MSQSIIQTNHAYSSTQLIANSNKLVLFRYGKVRSLKFAWDGQISTSVKVLAYLSEGDRPPQELTASVPGWLTTDKSQRIIIYTNGAIGILSQTGSYSDYFFAQISWIVE